RRRRRVPGRWPGALHVARADPARPRPRPAPRRPARRLPGGAGHAAAALAVGLPPHEPAPRARPARPAARPRRGLPTAVPRRRPGLSGRPAGRGREAAPDGRRAVTPAGGATLAQVRAELARLIRYDDESIVADRWIRQRYDIGAAVSYAPARTA